MGKVKKILTTLQDHLNLKNIQDLADYIGVKHTTVYGWIKRDKIGDTGKILGKMSYVNPGWLETGEGPMLRYQPPPGDAIAFNFKSKSKQQKLPTQEKGGESRVAAREAEEDWSVSEMLVMTSVVLESKTKYRSVLAENVKALYSAVQREEEMKTINEKLEAMAAENKEMAKRMARMEEMLLSLGAELPEKRDKKAM